MQEYAKRLVPHASAGLPKHYYIWGSHSTQAVYQLEKGYFIICWVSGSKRPK
jgi:hypothetical protein